MDGWGMRGNRNKINTFARGTRMQESRRGKTVGFPPPLPRAGAINQAGRVNNADRKFISQILGGILRFLIRISVPAERGLEGPLAKIWLQAATGDSHVYTHTHARTHTRTHTHTHTHTYTHTYTQAGIYMDIYIQALYTVYIHACIYIGQF